MKDVILYFEVDDMSIDEETGELGPAGIKLKIGQCDDEKYETVMKGINTLETLQNFVAYIGLKDMFAGKDFRLITKEQYDERYGDEE